jgi:hypothetical protein
VAHEFGHVLGYGHDDMGETVAVGERAMPLDDSGDPLANTLLTGLDADGDLLIV